MKHHRANIFFQFYKLTKPHSTNKDTARKEFILNIFLISLSLLSGTAFAINILYSLFVPNRIGADPIISGSFLGFMLFLYYLPRKNYSKLSAYIFIGTSTIFAIYMNYYWGADLPVLLLFFALLVVMTGILISSKLAFIVASANTISILLFTQLEVAEFYQPYNLWKGQKIQMTDSIVSGILLFIISVTSWLSNRSLEHALKRAHASESALRKQRNNLEETVQRKTNEIKKIEAEKTAQLYKFAEFGRTATGIFHDLANPLTLISLNLGMIKRKDVSVISSKETKMLLSRALQGTKALEQYVTIARNQIQNIDITQSFLLNKEINEVKNTLLPKAKEKK